jgi:1,4-dihydroxy-2-naphthoate octaprenyltransferase
LPLPLALFAWSGARRHGARIAEHPRYLAANVLVALASPALLALGLSIGS